MKKKKNLLLCLCLALAFTGTVATMTSCGETDGDNNQESVYDNGEEGTYYDVANEGNEITLDDGNFTLKLGEETVSGKYTYDGETLIIKTADTLMDAVLEDGELTFTYGGEEYTFLVKVNYTVSFSVEGTIAETDKKTVLNGKAVAKPETNPEKAGSVFVGWYTDATYKTLYNFNAPVTKDTTLYALFVEASELEYTVRYVVDGEEYGEAGKTVGGSVYNLPVVEKEGETFVGWWTSDFGSATKLTKQAEEGTKVSGDVTLYAVWKDAKPKISVTSSGVSWLATKQGDQYKVVIRNASGKEVLKQSTSSNSVA